MNRSVLILGLIGALVAPGAHAANWRKNCQSTSSAASMSLQVGNTACLVPTTATDNSAGTLGVVACDNIDILFFPDADGDATPSGATGQMRSCPENISATLTTTDGGTGEAACWVMEGITLDGVPGSNTEAIYGIPATRVFWEQVAYATTTEPIQVLVRCNGPTQ